MVEGGGEAPKDSPPDAKEDISRDAKQDIPQDSDVKYYLNELNKVVSLRAQQIAGKGKPVTLTHLTQALNELSTQMAFPEQPAPPKPTIRSRIAESITGVTAISAVLAVVFGTLALVRLDDTEGFLDIAKIFAGAIVGSTAASTASRTK